MSTNAPLYGIDVHPQFQRGFDFERAEALGYEFVFFKLSEGPYRDGTFWSHPETLDFARRAMDTGMVPGGYHYLVESHPGDPRRGGRVQAEHYLRKVERLGGPQGMMLAPDFEPYARPYSYLTPSNETLLHFNERLDELTGNHPIVLYSNREFWNSGTPSGDFDRYRANVGWEARYAYDEPMERPQRQYHDIKTPGGTWRPWEGFGGEKPMFWQFTAAGLVAGRNIDVNAFRLGMHHLRALTVAPLPNEDEDHCPGETPEPNPHPSGGLKSAVDRADDYGMRCVRSGIKYWCWDGGNLNRPRPSVGRPASVDRKAPDPDVSRRGFCADVLSWQLRRNGLPIPKNRFGNENYDGGTRAFRLRYAKQMIPFKLSSVRRGCALFVDFQTRWAPEGHITFSRGDGPDAKQIQSHLDSSCAHGEPGFNADWTAAESHGNGYYTSIIPAHVLWGDSKIRL